MMSMVTNGCKCEFVELDTHFSASRCHKKAKKRCRLKNKLGITKDFLVCNYHIGPLMNKAYQSRAKVIEVRLAL